MSTNSVHMNSIPEPIEQEPDAFVENIYAMPGTDHIPDIQSQDIMSEYLVERFTPEEPASFYVTLTPSGRTLPGITRTPVGYKEVTRLRKTDEWFISPRLAAGIMLGSMALFNGIGNHDTIEGAAKWAAHGVYRTFDPVGDRTVIKHQTLTVPGKVSHIEVNGSNGNEAGIASVDPAAITGFVHQVEAARQHGGRVIEIKVTGNTSDEWSSDSTIGVKDPDNTRLGQARAKAAAEALSADGLKLKADELIRSDEEHVIPLPQKQLLLKEAKADGYSGLDAAIKAVDRGDQVPFSLSQKIKRLFTGRTNRGVTLAANVEYPGKRITTDKTVKVRVPGHDHTPDVPKPHWYWFIPMLPIRRRERYNTVKPVSEWQFTPSQPIMRPKFVRHEKEQVWVRLRPEAVNDDGTLVEHPWAYTRKYEHLLRDDRIADVLRADFRDSKGKDKSLRVMFVDEAPAPETIEAFSELLKKFAAMEEGKLGERVSGIFVYPSENAGVDHGEPKRIAMGVDKQSHEDIMGTFTYVLDVVELHMPTTWDREELLELLESFNGPAFTAAHEVAGHGTDESDETLRLRRVLTRGIPQAHVVEGEPRAHKMRRLDKVLHNLQNRRRRAHSPVEFDIVYQVPDLNGQLVTEHARVGEDDPRLAHASQATIVGYKPTRYAAQSDSEHYAETAAAVTTGIVSPYEEADVTVPQLRTDSGERAHFATGYRPDSRGQRVFTESVGAAGGAFPVAFRSAPEVHITHVAPEFDPLMRQELFRARSQRTLHPAQMVAILARVARRNRVTGN